MTGWIPLAEQSVPLLYLAATKGVQNKIVNTDNLVIFILTAVVIWFLKDYLDKQKKEKAEYLQSIKDANEELKKTQEKVSRGEKADITIEARMEQVEKEWSGAKVSNATFTEKFEKLFDEFQEKISTERADDHTIIQELQREMARLIDSRVQPYANSVQNLTEQVENLKETLRLADKELSTLRGELKSHMQFTVFITMAASKVEQIDPSVAELVRDILEVPKLQELKGLHLASMERERVTQESDDSRG